MVGAAALGRAPIDQLMDITENDSKRGHTTAVTVRSRSILFLLTGS